MKKNEKNLPSVVSGQTVFLRYPVPEDLFEFITLNKASRKFHRGLVSPPLGKKDFDELILCNKAETNEGFFVCRNFDEAIVGWINLSQIFRKSFQNAYLGYFLGTDFTGRGYMTEAVRLILRFAFRNLKLHRVEANVQPQNIKSIEILQRCGFIKEGFSGKYLKISGRWRDHERWAIVRGNWK